MTLVAAAAPVFCWVDSTRWSPDALAGGLAGFVLALFGLGGQSGDLSTAAVLLVTLGGAIAGWVYGGWKRAG